MKIDKFKEEVEKLELRYVKSLGNHCIRNWYGETIAVVDEDKPRALSTHFSSFYGLQDMGPKKAERVFRLCVELARTPIDERKSEIKYYLKHKWIKTELSNIYLNQNTRNDSFFLADNSQMDNFKTQFTEKEIEEIKDKLDSNLEDFEWVEVE